MDRKWAAQQGEDGEECARAYRDKVVWVRRARRYLALEGRARNGVEEQEKARLEGKLGVGPAWEEVEERETSLRDTANQRRVERLTRWRNWLRKNWPSEPRKVYEWMRGGHSDGSLAG